MYDLAIINGRAYINGGFIMSNIYVLNGKIAEISKEVLHAKLTYDAKDRLVLPGLIDPHVHFELGGKVTSVDDFYTGSVCAAYGGITTFIDFLDPVSQGKEVKTAYNNRRNLASKSVVDYSFHMTVKNPLIVKEIVQKLKFYNLKSVKLFTTYSESGRRTYDSEIKELLEYSSLGDFVVLAHIEKDELIDLNDNYQVSDLPISRPSEAETEEALHLAKLVKETMGKLYMVHLSSGYTLEQLVESYEELINNSFFVESCPHYFSLTDSKYKEENGYLFTMAPPLRSEEEKNILSKDFKYIYSIGTDHCAYKSMDKSHSYLHQIPMGIGGIEHSFDIMFHLYGEECIDRMTINPAVLFGLYPEKGQLRIGSDADIMIYDNTKPQIIKKGHSNSDYSVYDGMSVDGRVESTILRGNFVVEKGQFVGGSGRFVLDQK